MRQNYATAQAQLSPGLGPVVFCAPLPNLGVGVGFHNCNHILCIGDSLTEGFPGKGKGGMTPYSNRLSQILRNKGVNVSIVNAGVSGQRTASMAQRLPGLLARAHPKFGLVLVLGGTNDLGHLQAAEIMKNLLHMHDVARAAGARVGLITIPECRDNASSFNAARLQVNQMLREFAARQPESTCLIDLATLLPQDLTHAHCWSADGLHCSPQGYEAMADIIADAVWPRGWL